MYKLLLSAIIALGITNSGLGMMSIRNQSINKPELPKVKKPVLLFGNNKKKLDQLIKKENKEKLKKRIIRNRLEKLKEKNKKIKIRKTKRLLFNKFKKLRTTEKETINYLEKTVQNELKLSDEELQKYREAGFFNNFAKECRDEEKRMIKYAARQTAPKLYSRDKIKKLDLSGFEKKFNAEKYFLMQPMIKKEPTLKKLINTNT